MIKNVKIVDRTPDGIEIRKVFSDPSWGKKWQFPTAYLLFKDNNPIPGSDRFSALGLARKEIGKRRDGIIA